MLGASPKPSAPSRPTLETAVKTSSTATPNATPSWPASSPTTIAPVSNASAISPRSKHSPISRDQTRKRGVSRLCEEIDEKVQAFLTRPIEGDWPDLWIDATYVKVRRAGRIVSVAVIVAVGANTDGRREILGLDVGPSEAETFWTEFLRSLARRGLRGVKLMVSGAYEALKAAAARVLNATWQRRRIYFMRNALAHAGTRWPTLARAAACRLSLHCHRLCPGGCRRRPGAVAQGRRLRPKLHKLAAFMDQAEADVLVYMGGPEDHWSKLPTNPLERLNGEIKCRTEVVGIFPNDPPASAWSAPCCSSRTTNGPSSAVAT